MIWMDVDIALSEVPVNVMPLTSDTDFKTVDETIAYNESGMALYWHFTTTAGGTTVTAVTPTTGGDYDWAHQDHGIYTIEITASGGASINNDTEGFGYFTGVCDAVLPWRGPTIGFRAAGLNNVMVDSAYSATRGLAGTALPDAAPGAAGGVFIAGSNAATSVTTALTANITGNLSGSVGSVTGAVGSVTGAVGSVAGNVDGSVASVVGAVGSVTGAVGSVTGAVGSVTGAVGSVAGNVDGSTASVTGAVGSVTGAVGSVGAGGIAAATFAAGAIDAAAIAAAAIDNATFAADVGSTAYATNIIALAVRKALDEIKLDHLVAVADADDVVDDSIIAKMSSLAGTADWSAFDNTTDSLQAIRDRGDAAWTTGGGTGLTALGSGTAQSGTTSTIVLAAASAFPTASLNGNVINLHAGTGAGQSRVILSNTLGDDTCNIYPPWAVDPDATSEYEIVQGSTNLAAITSSGTAADNLLLIADRTFSVTTEVAVSDTALSFTLTDGGAADDAYNDMTISVQNGAGDGRWESRRISDWTSGKVVTVDSAFSFTPGGLDSVVIWNNRACSEGGGGGSSSITDITAAALAQFFTVDSTKDFSADAVAGSVVKEIASNCSALGAGAITDTFTVTVSGAPVANCSVWVTSDQAGTAVIVSGTANSSGVVTFSLDVATGYWVWAAIAGYTFASFSPAEFDVASGGFSWA